MTFESLPEAVRTELVAACESFEDEWNLGLRPQIEQYLSARTEPERTVLLQMLLGVEVELRRSAGERPVPGDYTGRFELDTEMIRTMLAEPVTEAGQSFVRPIHQRSTVAGSGDPSGETVIHDVPVPGNRPSPPVPDQIGRYQVLGLLGYANFVVYLASEEGTDRLVAIKVARPGDNTNQRRLMSLADEAEKLKALDHPGIVKLYEYVPAGGTGVGSGGYIVLEYIEGQTLEELLRSGPVPVLRLVRILARVAEAVDASHSAGFVHRDLKPSNILLDVRGEPHVGDFGLAVDEEVQQLRRGEIAGTVEYMAPEQVRGETPRLDCRTDIWALGVILYRGLTSRLPFPGRTHDEVFEEILERDPRPPRMSSPGIEPELERICLRCLAKRMSERYLTASDLASDLNRMIEGQPRKPSGDRVLFKGLRPFDGEDSGFFLDLLPGPKRSDGMPESVRFWKDRIEASDGEKCFHVGVIYGPSGGGKSSFVRAALLPNLDRARVRSLRIEADPLETESRLLAGLRREAPLLPAGVNPPDAVALLRDGSSSRTGGKLLLVIDQFEQWLQAHPDEPDAELVRALRQCDGRHVQALLLVRDDFWMALTRFLQVVEVPLALGGNAAAVELFDARHARHVLEEFGRSLGQIPEDADPIGGEAALFVEEAVRGLTGRDDRISPIRLILFTEVVRRRPWTPETLRSLGGVDGIGVKFLDDCFAAVPYQEHRGAAMKLLGALLPPPTSAIRGAPVGASTLRAESGYDGQPDTFAKLLGLLDRELRLIVPTENHGPEPASQGSRESLSAVPGEPSYQLAHDYLVRPIRQWTEREQGRTRGARARLRLRLITASWLERAGPRQLPSLLEWIGILRHVPASQWSADERKLMHATNRHYLTRGVTIAALLIGLVLGGNSIRDRAEATNRLERALLADFRALPEKLDNVVGYRNLVIPNLEAHQREGSSPHEREVASIILYRLAPTLERGTALREYVLSASGADEIEVLREALAVEPQSAGADALFEVARNEASEPGRRIRAAAALARIAREDQRLATVARPLLRALWTEDRRMLASWIKLLEPVHPSLAKACEEESRNPGLPSSARGASADVLAVMLALGRPEEVWKSLRHAANPTLRSFLIDELARLEIDLMPLVRHLHEEITDPAELQGVLLALAEHQDLGSVSLGRLPPQAEVTLLKVAGGLYSDHPDPGVHSAAELLLKRLGGVKAIPRLGATAGRHRGGRGRRWELGPNNHTLVILPGPLEFRMGSPANEEGRNTDRGETLHYRRIDRSLAVATTEVTVEQFQVFLQENPQLIPQRDRRYTDGEQGWPANWISWPLAVEYCNWLSLKAGIDPQELCYPETEGPEIVVPGNVVERQGYRLPTEAEWEYFCRARSETSRPYGESVTLLPRYAWSVRSLVERPSPVGRLLPNEFGLFDTLGNLWEWCHDGGANSGEIYVPYPSGTKEQPAADRVDSISFNDGTWRYVRGGAYFCFPARVRPAHRDSAPAADSHDFMGFRVVRMLPPESD